MSRTSSLRLTFVLVLIVGLGVALPATAKPAEQAPAIQQGLLERLWSWVEQQWQRSAGPRQDLQPVTAGAGTCDSDRGVLIDPNGDPCNH